MKQRWRCTSTGRDEDGGSGAVRAVTVHSSIALQNEVCESEHVVSWESDVKLHSNVTSAPVAAVLSSVTMRSHAHGGSTFLFNLVLYA